MSRVKNFQWNIFTNGQKFMKLAKLKTCEYFRGWHVMGMWPDLIMWGWSHVKTDEMGVGVYSFVFHCVHVFWGLDRSHNDLLWSLLWCHGQRLCRAVCWLHGCQNDSESSTIHSLSSLTPKLKAGEGLKRGYSSLSSELGLGRLCLHFHPLFYSHSLYLLFSPIILNYANT